MQKYLIGHITYNNELLGCGIWAHSGGAILTSHSIVQQVIKFYERDHSANQKFNVTFHATLISENGTSPDQIEISVPAYVLPHSIDSIFGLFIVEDIEENIKARISIPKPTIITEFDAPFKNYDLRYEPLIRCEQFYIEPASYSETNHRHGFAFEIAAKENLCSGAPIFNRHDVMCGLLIEVDGQWGVASLPDVENMMEYSEKTYPGVMLSYKREEVALVDIFREQLILRGIPNVWMDIKKIETGHQWWLSITEGIRTRSHVVAFVSERALQSEIIRREYVTANTYNKTVIPILIQGVGYGDVPDILSKHQIASDYIFDYTKFKSLQDIKIEDIAPGKDTPERRALAEDLMPYIIKLASELPRTYVKPSGFHYFPSSEFQFGLPHNEQVLDCNEFWMAETPVTMGEYICFVELGGYTRELRTHWDHEHDFVDQIRRSGVSFGDGFKLLASKHPSRPMYNISYYEARAYCRWLTSVMNHEFRLPSEIEWEKAARESIINFGHSYIGWDLQYADIDSEKSVPKSYDYLEKPRAESIHCRELLGSVWEWTSSVDCLLQDVDKYRNTAKTDSAPRIIRGASWKSKSNKARPYHRESEHPGRARSASNIGFRLVTTIAPDKFYS